MTIQDKVNLVTPNAQNLFLLYNNPSLLRDTKEVNSRFSVEIQNIKKPGALTKILTREVGSPELQKEIDIIVRKIDLFSSPQRTPIHTLVILMILGVDPIPLICDLDKNSNALANPIWWDINPGPEGTGLTISLSNFHNKTDLISFIEKRWKEVEEARKPYKNTKTKIERPKNLF